MEREFPQNCRLPGAQGKIAPKRPLLAVAAEFALAVLHPRPVRTKGGLVHNPHID